MTPLHGLALGSDTTTRVPLPRLPLISILPSNGSTRSRMVTGLRKLSLLVAAGWLPVLYRIRAEERVLAGDAGWSDYRARVRFRLVPGIW